MVKLQTHGIDLFINISLLFENNKKLFQLNYSNELFNDKYFLNEVQQHPIISSIYKDYIKEVLSIIKLEHDDDIDSIADSILKMKLKFSEIM